MFLLYVPVQEVIFSLCIDRESMQMVDYQMIYSPKTKKQWPHNELIVNHFYIVFDEKPSSHYVGH
jgi:hypothetical protein